MPHGDTTGFVWHAASHHERCCRRDGLAAGWRPRGNIRAVSQGRAAAVRVERSGPVSTVVLDRPQVRNAVDGHTAAALADAFRAFDADPGAAVAVLYGAGGTFCAGADLKAVGTERGNRVAE